MGDSITVYGKSGTQWITARIIKVENRAVAAPPEEPKEETGAGEPGTDSTIVSDENGGQLQTDTQGKV